LISHGLGAVASTILIIDVAQRVVYAIECLGRRFTSPWKPLFSMGNYEICEKLLLRMSVFGAKNK